MYLLMQMIILIIISLINLVWKKKQKKTANTSATYLPANIIYSVLMLNYLYGN